MKKTGKYIIIMLAVLVVLGGAFAALRLLPTENEETDSSSSASSEASASEPILDKDMAEVASVEVVNQEDSYTLLPVKSAGETVEFTLDGYEDYDLNTALLTSNVRTLVELKAVKDLGGQENLNAFGLGSGAPEVTLNYTSGGSDKLVLGDNAAESVGKYVLKDGVVYVISGVPVNLFESKFSYFNTELYSVADRMEITEDENGEEKETVGLDILYSMTLSGTQYPEPVNIEYTSRATSNYLITTPITAESGNSTFETLMTALKTLTASAAVNAGITEEKLEQYGLSEPEAEISFNMNDSEHTLAVSAEDAEGNRYLLADGRDVVYQVSGATVEAWAESSISKLRMSYVWIPNIKNVKKLTVTVDGDQVHAYHITRTKNEEKSTESNIQYDLSIENAGGEAVDYDEGYQPFYQAVISLAVFSQEESSYSGTADVKVVYEYFDGGSDTLELYKLADSNRYAAVLNGGFNGQVRSSEVTAMLDQIP